MPNRRTLEDFWAYLNADKFCCFFAFLTARRESALLNPAKLYLGFGCKHELLLSHRLSDLGGDAIRSCFA